MPTPGIEPGTFGLVDQRLIHSAKSALWYLWRCEVPRSSCGGPHLGLVPSCIAYDPFCRRCSQYTQTNTEKRASVRDPGFAVELAEIR